MVANSCFQQMLHNWDSTLLGHVSVETDAWMRFLMVAVLVWLHLSLHPRAQRQFGYFLMLLRCTPQSRDHQMVRVLQRPTACQKTI